MALIKRDIMNPNKLEVVTTAEALDEALHLASLGWEGRSEKTDSEHNKLKEIIGALLNSLSKKKLLTEPEIVTILNAYTITHAVAQE